MVNLALNQLPEDMTRLQVDPEHLNRVLISGCFEQHLIVNGITRKFIVYLPKDIENDQQCIIIAPPSRVNILEFLVQSGFKRLADKQKIFIFLLIPGADGWDLSGTDADFMNAVYIAIQNRDYYVTMQDNIYACGIADGADIAHQAAQKMTSEWSGLFTIGDLNAALMENILSVQSQCQTAELLVTAEKTQLPVWMDIQTPGMENDTAISYWKKQNNTVEPYLTGQGADYIWMPSPIHHFLELDEEFISQVRVSVRPLDISYNRIETIWDYIRLARRHRGQSHKNLRYYKNPVECGAVLQTRNIDGFNRIWYEFIPECCTPEQKWPVVVVMHGRGGTAETFFDITNMFMVANRRRFIAVFPQAGVFQQNPSGVKNVTLWNGIIDGKPFDDVKFIQLMIRDLEERLPVDMGRIYACGQSSGGIMADTLWKYTGSLFAATAAWSGLNEPDKLHIAYEESNDITPSLILYGEHCRTMAGNRLDTQLPFSISERFRESMMEKFKRYGLHPENVQTWRDYPITWYCWSNRQGVPLLTVGIVDNMAHANYPEESWISYDQFFCQFHRDSQGQLCYRGEVVKLDN